MDSKEPASLFYVREVTTDPAMLDVAERTGLGPWYEHRPATAEDITDALIEQVGLALRNADADDHGWPPIFSLSDNDDRGASEYRRQAEIALRAVFS